MRVDQEIVPGLPDSPTHHDFLRVAAIVLDEGAEDTDRVRSFWLADSDDWGRLLVAECREIIAP